MKCPFIHIYYLNIDILVVAGESNSIDAGVPTIKAPLHFFDRYKETEEKIQALNSLHDKDF